MSELTLTAVICTRNRAARLGVALESLAVQTGVTADQFDVLVVDNGSSDNTLEVAEEWGKKLPFRLTTAVEPRMGVSFARNKSVEVARGDVIAFLDDDAIANAGWAAGHLDAYKSDPMVRGVMGRILPIWEAERPDWLDSSLETYLTVADYGEEPFDVSGTGHAPVGANMSLSRQAMLDAGGFDVRFGFGGLMKIPHEENDIASRIQRLGWKIVYWPRATVRHGVPADRMTLKWFKRRVFDQGRGEYLFDVEHHGRGRVLKKAVIGALVRGPVFAAVASIDYLLGNRARAARRASVSWYLLGYLKELACVRAHSSRTETAA